MRNNKSTAHHQRKSGAAIVYRRCAACGCDYDEELLRSIENRLICLLCISIVKMRKQNDAANRLRNEHNGKS